MPVLNSLAETKDTIAKWRRHIHENPGILYEVEETAAFVAEKLEKERHLYYGFWARDKTVTEVQCTKRCFRRLPSKYNQIGRAHV